MSAPSTAVYAAAPTAIYARVSTLVQGEDEKTSLQVQVNACTAFAPSAGLVVDPQCVAKEAFTATRMDRPALERLLVTMRQRGVRHLVMDRADRVTREGQIVAGVFLNRLMELGITLHIAAEHLTLDNDMAVNMFLTLAFAAKKDNEYRARRVQDNRREAARRLRRYARGNRPPYGWRFEPLEVNSHGKLLTVRLVHDHDTFPILERMIRERQQGTGYWGIATHLTDAGIPTPVVQAGQNKPGEENKVWHASTVQKILKNPVNAGVLTSFRHRRVEMPPDEHHPTRWYRAEPLPLSEQIVLPSDLVEDPPLTMDEWRWLISREARAPWPGAQHGDRGQWQQASGAHGDTDGGSSGELPALCGGGLLLHDCGGRLRVKRATRHNQTNEGIHHYVYYVCRRHEYTPAACPGITVDVAPLDALVWKGVRLVLLTPGHLEVLAEQQRQADLTGLDTGAGGLRHLREVQADLLRQQETFMTSLGRATDEYSRRLYESKITELGPKLAEAEQRIAEQQRVADDEQHRQGVLADVRAQLGRYVGILAYDDLLPPARRVAFQQRVLRSLGFTATVTQQPDGRVLVGGELRLASGIPHVWFDPDEYRQAEERLRQAGVTEASIAQRVHNEQAALHMMADRLPEVRRAIIAVMRESEGSQQSESEETPCPSNPTALSPLDQSQSSDGQPSAPQPEESVVVETEAGTLVFVQKTTSSR